MFGVCAKVENGVTKSGQNFRRKTEKTQFCVSGLGSALNLRRSARDVVAGECIAPRGDRSQMSMNALDIRGGFGERIASGADWAHDGG